MVEPPTPLDDTLELGKIFKGKLSLEDKVKKKYALFSPEFKVGLTQPPEIFKNLIFLKLMSSLEVQEVLCPVHVPLLRVAALVGRENAAIVGSLYILLHKERLKQSYINEYKPRDC